MSLLLHGAETTWSGLPPRGCMAGGPVRGWNGCHPALTRLVAQLRPSLVLDVGVWAGQSTITLARALRDHSPGGCVVAIDTFLGSLEHWVGQEAMPRPNGRPEVWDEFIGNVVASGVESWVVPLPQTSLIAARILAHHGLRPDLVHLDASHEYEDVALDAAAYWDLLRPGGVLVGDDYDPCWPGVQQAAHELAARQSVELVVDHPKWIVTKELD